MRNGKGRVVLYILIFLLSFFAAKYLLNESISQSINIVCFLVMGAIILIKSLKVPGFPELISVVGMPFMPVLTKLLAASPFSKHVSTLYNYGIKFFFEITGINSNYRIGSEESIMFSFWIVFFAVVNIYSKIDHTAMKIRRGSDEYEFKQRNYTEKSEMFCKTLHQRLESINRETDWNENLFTPVQAEVEVNIKGKHKKKCEDLLKCLKSVRHRGAIFLVLGEPGSGKSVSLRKLCMDLLDESRETKKIPVYINLKKWNRDWSLECLPRKKDLIEFIKETLYENGDIFTDGFLNTYFDKMLEDGRWYFIFDSFDEMPCLMGKQNCQELIDEISELLCQFMTGANQSGGVIASRLYKSPSEAIGATVVLKIQEFNDIKIKTMLQKYLNNAQAIIRELFGKRENLVVLCRNPFYLTLLINYIKDKGLEFPQNQMELYQNFVDGRLGKCSEKLENEQITSIEVHNMAKKLAVFMQESSIYGLECPTAALLQGKDDLYWKKALKLLEYVKICRLGGESETVSFVHRRFQEFFLVESIIERGQDIEYEEYKDIVSNASMRDALVLYCEVIEEGKAREIAKFCWDVIQKNIVHAGSVLEAGGMELVNTLYFMAEAFRSRKSVIRGFKKEFECLIDNTLNNKTDFVVLLACTNCMVLFDQSFLQRMVLKVFQLKNRWLNDIVIQNCRVFKRLDDRIETQITNYFLKMDTRTFLDRFRNTQFSLSLSKNFRYVKRVHFMTFVIYISFIASMFVVVLLMGVHFLNYFFQNSEPHTLQSASNMNLLIEYPNESKILFSTYTFNIFFIIFFFFWVSKNNVISYFKICIFIFCEIILNVMTFIVYRGFWENIFLLYNIFLITFMLTIMKHDIVCFFKHTKLNTIFCRKNAINCLLISVSMVIVYSFIYFVPKKINPLKLGIFICACFILTIIILVSAIFFFIKDLLWIRKKVNVRSITRSQIYNNLQTLHFRKFKLNYIEQLLQQKVTLTGEWPNGTRPKHNDDRLEMLLAKLDCLTLGSYDYLF